MNSTRKPVIVRKLTRDWCGGYATANPDGDAQHLELLLNSGKLLQIAWQEIKWVCYVRELDSGNDNVRSSGMDTLQPERLLRRRFLSRPRIAGLWLRLTLADGEELEGVAANDSSLITGAGLMLTPPDTRSNTQRIFVPRSAIRELTVLGVMHPAGKRHPGSAPQAVLFEMEERSAE